MSKADFDRWQKRYARAGPPEPADPFVVEVQAALAARGQALDVAGGGGRHALLLARRGLHVTVVDISAAGLEIADRRARDAGLSIATLALDLDEAPLPEGPFDAIVCTSFLPSRNTWKQIVQGLAPRGKLVYVQPTTTNLQRHSHPSRRVLLEPGELERIVATLGLEAVRLEEGWDSSGRHTARVLAALPAP